MTAAIIDLAKQYGRYGYRRFTALHQIDGLRVNHMLVERIWRKEGLKVPARQRKRGRLWLNDGSCIRLRPQYRNHVWTYDFVHERTQDGKALRLFDPGGAVALALQHGAAAQFFGLPATGAGGDSATANRGNGLTRRVVQTPGAGHMQVFLDEVASRYPTERIVMILDGAGWHKAHDIILPANLHLLHLPPYAPELNPVEHVWDDVREKHSHNRVFHGLDAVETQLAKGLISFESDPERIKAIVAW